MSDRSPEDELIAEAVKFGRSFQQMLRAHAQAANWLERRRIRKQISLTLREQRRAEQAARDHQLGWTQQMVDHYRVHASTVADRAVNPNIDHERRYRDSQILAEHADYLRSKIITNPRLTPTEQGIGLDGLDAATTFPHFEPGKLFKRAHKVKGIEALRYRAQVARTKASLNTTHDRSAAPRQLGRDTTEDVRAESVTTRESGTADPQPQRAEQERFTVIVGPSEAIEQVKVPRSPRIARDDLPRTGTFETREKVYDWTVQQLGAYREHSTYRDGQFSARIYEWNHPERTEHVDGPIGMVTDEVRALRDQHTRRDHATPEPLVQPPQAPAVEDARIAQVERQLTDMAADRDRLASRVEILQRGLDAVTADRDEVKRRLGSADARIEELKNRNLRLANEIDELRERPTVEQVAAERDRYKGERDEAVAKLEQATPEHDRYGSKERIEFDQLGNTEHHPRPTRQNADDSDRNGKRRNGIERSR